MKTPWEKATLVATGTGLVTAAVVVSSVYSRRRGDLDGSTFTVGALATLGLLGIAVLAHLRLHRRDDRPDAFPHTLPDDDRATLVSWPGAFGAVSAGAMLAVLIDDDPASTYVGSLVVMALCLAGYALAPRTPFVLAGLLGFAVLFAQAFSDVFDAGGGDNTFMIIGSGILAYVLLATGLGWLVPGSRSTSGVVVGAAGLVAMIVDLVALSLTRAITGSAFFTSGDSRHRYAPADPYKNDVYVVLAFCVALGLLWALAAVVTGHVGFRVLVAADAVAIIPLGAYALHAHHPTWWGVVPAAVGGAILVLVGLSGRRGTPTAVDGPLSP